MDNTPVPGLADGSMLEQWITVVGALCFLLAILFLGFWMLRRFGPKAGFGGLSRAKFGMRVEGCMPIGPKKQLVVVRILNKLVVLGVTDHSINLLTELDEDHDRNEHGAFETAMDKARRKGASS